MVTIRSELGFQNYAGTYILAPGFVNHKQHYNYGFYWIKDDGTTAIWYCKTCTNIRFLIGPLRDLGEASGTISGWYKDNPEWINEWKYANNGGWVATDGISVSPGTCKNS